MITPPRKLQYAVEAVVYIACNAGQAPVSGKEIADRQHLAPRHLEQLMQKLVRAGILRGVRGPRGGYRLARERRRITVADICIALTDEEDAAPHVSTPIGKNVVWPLMQKAQGAAMTELAKTTIADLCDRAHVQRVARRSDAKADFAI